MRKSPITLLSFAALLLASLCLQAQESEPRKITSLPLRTAQALGPPTEAGRLRPGWVC